MSLTTDPLRWLLAIGLLLAYAVICYLVWRGRPKRRSATLAAAGTEVRWVVAYASQTGTAAELAVQAAATLQSAGGPAVCCQLSELSAERLRQMERVLFVASTYGEGDPPDNGAVFAEQVLGTTLPLPQLHYAVLALGDSGYRNFCGFGRALDAWLLEQGAQPLFERIDVDQADATAIAGWHRQLQQLAGVDAAAPLPFLDSQAPYAGWRLVVRRWCNPRSSGEPAYHLELEPADGSPLPDWQSGDLVQVRVPGDPDRPRDYSIASMPGDGRIHLLVRQRRQGSVLGHASGWLTEGLAVGEVVQLRLRPHPLFRLDHNTDRPLILIGNGTGIAGLRGHLKARAGRPAAANWLIFGERHAAADNHYRDDLEAWQSAGVLERLDLVFSRDQPQRRYVQHRLREAGDAVRAWVERGAAIYVCGSLKGMAAGVDEALAELLGREQLQALALEGRYRRDVY